MKKIKVIAYYELLKNIRDIKMLLILILSPIILIFILGNSLDSFLTASYVEPPLVGYVNLDKGNMSHTFNVFLQQDEISELIEIRNFSTKEEATNAIEEGIISSMIFIDDNYSSQLQDEEETEIEILGKENRTYVAAIVNNYVNTYNLNASIIENDFIPIEDGERYTIERGLINSKESYPKSIDYYAVQTLLQFLLLCSIFGVSIVMRDYQKGLSVRIKSLPVHKHEFIIGRLIGSIMYSFIAAIIIIIFSKYVYNANWNGNPLLIYFTILLFVVISNGLGVLLGSFTNNYTSSFGILALLAVVLPASVGAFSPKTLVKPISFIAPNRYALNIIFGTIYDYPKRLIMNGFIGLFIMLIIVYAMIIFFEGRRKYENI